MARGHAARAKGRTLAAARRLYRQRRYARLINLLEPQVFLYRQNPDYYYLLGVACLQTGDFAGAYSYLQRSLDLERSPRALLALGTVYLRRRQTDAALRMYLDVIEEQPRNRRARRALSWMRSIDDPDDVIAWFESGRIRRIMPPRGFALPGWARTGLVVAILAAAAWLGVTRLAPFVLDMIPREQRDGSEFITIESPDQTIVTTDSAPFEFTQDELEELFRRVGRDFNAGRDNLVRRDLNRIEQSNASAALKTRAQQVRSFLESPSFAEPQQFFSHAEVAGEPLVYDRTYVRWRGRIANLEVGDEAIRFDLLVNYETGRVVDGIVPVILDFPVLLENDRPVELIAEVRLHGRDEQPPFYLRATAIRRLAPGEIGS